jgi:hypothetical protein
MYVWFIISSLCVQSLSNLYRIAFCFGRKGYYQNSVATPEKNQFIWYSLNQIDLCQQVQTMEKLCPFASFVGYTGSKEKSNFHGG